MVSESYQPQPESLVQLHTKIQQLQRILDRNNSTKARIFQSIDDLIKLAKPSNDKSDIQEVIKHINDFIDVQSTEHSTVNGTQTNGHSPNLELDELRLQNMKLRQIYQQKKEYYEEAIRVNQDYEETINLLLEKFKSIKHQENMKKINETRIKALKLKQMEKDEFEIFDAYLSVDQANNKLVHVISDLIDIINKDADNDISLINIYQLIHQLQFYEAKINKGSKNMYYIKDFDKFILDQIKG